MATNTIKTVLIANRGEIACRVIRTLRAQGIRSVAVYSDADADSLHVRLADEAVHIGPAAATASYLDISKVIDAAKRVGADAVHPGYGFLSENAAFARALQEASILFLGPPTQAIEVMGDKIAARAAVSERDVPVVPGISRPGLTDDELIAAATDIGFPVLIKPSAGGGGKGMHRVEDPAKLAAALNTARREAGAAFGDDTLFMERFVDTPRHIEVQVLADTHGNVVHLGERECSLQRRHQKVIEEAPSALLDAATRARIGAAACDAARSVGYTGAGTVEFIVSAKRPDEFFFMEMNTRLQVEHPVTEAITGLDLVAWQIRVACGEALPITQEQVPLIGHAIEVRLYAEDPANEFLPATGKLTLYRESAAGEGRRVDSGVSEGDVVSPFYDPMLGKLIAWGEDREQARLRLLAMLDEFAIGGLKTNIAFLRRILAHPAFAAAELDTGFIPRHQEVLLPAPQALPAGFWEAAAEAWLQGQAAYQRSDDHSSPWAERNGLRLGLPSRSSLHLVSGGQDQAVALERSAASTWQLVGEQLVHDQAGVRRQHLAIRRGGTLYLHWDGEMHAIEAFDPIAEAEASHSHQGGLGAPMNGSIVRVLVEPGQVVEAGTALVVLEAMKMEHSIRAPHGGTVKALFCQEGDMVSEGTVLVELAE